MRIPLIAVVTVVLLGGPRAGDAQYAVGVKAGTTGLGADASYSVLPRLALRVSGSFMPVKPEGTFSDLDFQVEMPSPLFTLGADLYLLGGLRLMGGVLVGAEETTITGVFQSGTVNLGGQSYTRAQLGRLRGDASSRNLAPYVGLGFGTTVGPGWGLSLEVGSAFLGQPDLELSANGSCMQADPCRTQLQQSLEIEEADIQDELDSYAKVFPMVSIGLRFGFGPR